MKDILLELAAKAPLHQKWNVMREYLQALILRALHEAGFFRTNAFVGGTALRFLYQVPRYSEDLDFSAVSKSNLDFLDVVKKVRRELELSGFDVVVSNKTNKTVHEAFFRFPGILHAAGVSAHENQNLSIKIEVDTNPPSGAKTATQVTNKYFPLTFLSYDPPSLFAGKLHALLNRRYTKGRDLFDLGWYLSRWPDITPNMKQLQNSLKQTGWDKPLPTVNSWRTLIGNAVEKMDWRQVTRDVENFLERSADLDVFSQENILRLLSLRAS